MDRREALKALMSLPATAQVSVASLKPTDVIVIECDEDISEDTVTRIKAAAQTVWTDQQCVVLSKGMKLRIVSSTPPVGRG